MAATSETLPPKLPGPAVLHTGASLFLGDRFDSYVTARYPTVIRMGIVGVGEIVAVRDPAVVKQIFTASTDAVIAGPINRRVLPTLGEDSVMMIDGERHIRMRRLLLPPFHGDAIRAYEEMIEKIAVAEIDAWPHGTEFSLHPRMQSITIEVILTVVLGVEDRGRRDRLRALLPKVLEANPIAFLLEGRWPWLAAGPIGRIRPWVRARREAERLLREELAAHRERGGEGEDILSMLLASRDEDGRGLSDSEVEGQLLTLLLAGHETTATSLAWCFERLVRNPAALARLQAGSAGGGTEYLDATIKETMRTRPVVEAVWRVLREPFELGGYMLPAGTVVAPVIRAVGMEGREDAAEFRPERFLEADDQPYSLIPFGGGTRRCLGASFATMEMRIVIRAVLSRLDLRALDPKPEKVSRSRRFTASPARGARVVATAAGRS